MIGPSSTRSLASLLTQCVALYRHESTTPLVATLAAEPATAHRTTKRECSDYRCPYSPVHRRHYQNRTHGVRTSAQHRHAYPNCSPQNCTHRGRYDVFTFFKASKPLNFVFVATPGETRTTVVSLLTISSARTVNSASGDHGDGVLECVDRGHAD
ncbi:hypothetical protein FPV67DRAFT_1468412 [Lyophyllum atratum]|nr:hypothetical protein FPV67DRAFT_1468412 [Lyophyllum atratum]